MLLGEMISAYRAKKKMSLHALSKKSGVEKTALWRLEHGQDASAHHWRKIFLWIFSE